MRRGRLQDLSVIYWLKDKLTGTGVEVLDGFPEGDFNIPSVAVEWDNLDTYELELGSKERVVIRGWWIDIFAVTKTQKDEIVYKLLDDIEEEINVYNYNEGFPPSVSPTKTGVLKIVVLKAKNIKVFPELTEKLYHRATVYFETQYETIGGI